MDLHLHLSVAFRALDKKWGPAVDLDTSDLSLPCLPAVIDRPTTTFSSEEYLKKRYRAKPYSRVELRKEDVNTSDSFADISSSRVPKLRVVPSSMASGLNEDCRTVTNFVEELERCDSFGDHTESSKSLDAVVENKRPVNRIFKQLKSSARSIIGKKRWKKEF